MRDLGPDELHRRPVRKLGDTPSPGEEPLAPGPGPVPIPFGSRLDGWDVLLVIAGIALGAAGEAALGAETPLVYIFLGFVIGIAALAVRRRFDRAARDREEIAMVRPPRPRNALAEALVAVGAILTGTSAFLLLTFLFVFTSVTAGDRALGAAIIGAPGLVGVALVVGGRRAGRPRGP